jgi:hypothetical protein
MTFNQYLLCTDDDLLRNINNLRAFASQYMWARAEIQKLQDELARRENQRTARNY